MGSIRHWPRKAATTLVFEDAFDELRDAFYERLHDERVCLAGLSAALAPAEDNPARIFAKLADCARLLRGRAAIFEISTVAEAASALEQAALGASISHAADRDVPVRTALAELVRLLTTVEATSSHDSVANTD